FSRASGNYFQPDVAQNPLLHTWSLAVEEQFYLVWPVLLLLISVLPRRGGRVIAMAIFTAVFLIGCVLLTGRRPVIAFYSSPARAWEFGIGALASMIPVSMVAASRISVRHVL